jgi:hypothetical protein
MNMAPEITLLVDAFDHEPWDATTQTAYMDLLTQQDGYRGSKVLRDPAFSARDRINRAPKALGFVDLNPSISLTPAGDEFINGNRPNEALPRQLLKSQLPSPFHKLPKGSDLGFHVKPYLEIIRLIKHFGSLGFHELMAFGMQLTNIDRYK